jgi:protein TonB
MNFSNKQQNPARKYVGIGIVVLLHVAVVYALVNGLARKVVEIVQAPLETKIIEELKKLPPPPPPPKPKEPPPEARPEPKPTTTPPVYVPPVEVAVQAPVNNAPTIGTTSQVPPPQPEAPPVPRAPVLIAPVANAASCKKPSYPSVSRRNEEQGVVVLRFLVAPNGSVIKSEVKSTSGFERLDEAARQALSLCSFKPGTADGEPTEAWAQMKYEWRLE